MPAAYNSCTWQPAKLASATVHAVARLPSSQTQSNAARSPGHDTTSGHVGVCPSKRVYLAGPTRRPPICRFASCRPATLCAHVRCALPCRDVVAPLLTMLPALAVRFPIGKTGSCGNGAKNNCLIFTVSLANSIWTPGSLPVFSCKSLTIVLCHGAKT